MKNMNKGIIIALICSLIVIIGLLVVVIFLLLNKNITDSPSVEISTTTISTTTTTQNVLTGSYAISDAVYPLNLDLKPDKTFEADVNLCEGISSISGTYKIDEKYVYLSFKVENFSGFSGDDLTSLKFEIKNNKKLKLITSGFACGPIKGDIYNHS